MNLERAFKIAIVGGGPAGLMLANLLLASDERSALPKTTKLSITIFESDTSSTSRTSQGGTLDLHAQTGILALKKAGLYNAFLERARYDGTSLQVCDKNAVAWFKTPGGGGAKNETLDRPEIDRVELRALLMRGLTDKEDLLFEWGKKVIAVTLLQNCESSSDDEEEASERTFELTFNNGEKSSQYNLVVGADGAWSKVRSSQLDSITKPEYSGIAGYVFSIPDAEKNAPVEWKFVNKGSLFSFGDHKGLTAQQLGDGTVSIGTWAVTSSEAPPQGSAKKTKSEVLEMFPDWSERLRAFVHKAENEESECRYLFHLPADYKWTHQPGITLLGDAAHLMMPFAGEGVNLAFEDAIFLSNAILTSLASETWAVLDNSLRIYEENMGVRAGRAQRMTRKTANAMLFTAGGPEGGHGIEEWLLSFLGYMLGEEIWWKRMLWPGVVSGVYLGYGGFRVGRWFNLF